ncbi:MAG: hypothetical protein ACREFX_13990 [Opitutaceae bacterium]
MKKIIFALAAGLAASAAFAQMSLRQTPDAIVVTSSGHPGYRIKLDLKQSGVATEFCIPAHGPNYIGQEGGQGGLFGLYVQGGSKGVAPPDGDTYGERTVVKGDGVLDHFSVVTQTPAEIVVALQGHASGWGTYSRTGETFIDYKSQLTFEANRIIDDGSVTWVCGHHTAPDYIDLDNMFAPYSVRWPVRLVRPDGRPQELRLADNDEIPYPAGITNPVTAQIWFHDGRCLLFRTLETPADWVSHPWLTYEHPWLTHWRLSFAFTNDPAIWQPTHTPVHYRYEVEIPAKAPANPPPDVYIVSPPRAANFFKDDPLDRYSGLQFKVGDVVRFAAIAKDAKGGCLPDSAFHWSINWGERVPPHVAATGTGSQIFFTVPPADVGSYWIEVSARDSQGFTGEDYITFKVVR